MQLRKLKYLGGGAMLLNMLLADICKVANPGTAFIVHGADWLKRVANESLSYALEPISEY